MPTPTKSPVSSSSTDADKDTTDVFSSPSDDDNSISGATTKTMQNNLPSSITLGNGSAHQQSNFKSASTSFGSDLSIAGSMCSEVAGEKGTVGTQHKDKGNDKENATGLPTSGSGLFPTVCDVTQSIKNLTV